MGRESVELKYETFECNANGEITWWPSNDADSNRFCAYYGCQGGVRIHGVLKCSSIILTTFESSENFDWCNETNRFGSYGLIVNNTIERSQIAEICFRYETTTPQIIKYFSVPKILIDHNNFSMNSDLWENELTDTEITYENVGSSVEFNLEIFEEYFPNKEYFEYENLVQNGILNELGNQNYYVGVNWWHNLRVSNWKRYLKALDEQSEKSIYKVYAGTGGKFQVPFGEFNLTISKSTPAYIWNVLQEVNGTEEFVIIGYNSPYFEVFDEEETILCEDMCDKISWLENISKLLKHAHFGRMFCCSLENALKTDILEGLTL